MPERRPAAFTSRTLLNIRWLYLLRHPWQSALMVLGIALGVAVGVDLANASATRAFDYSTDSVAGRATHQIVAGPQGLDEVGYVELRRRGLTTGDVPAAPIVTDYVYSPQLGDRPFQLLGVDPFAEAPFRNYLWGAGEAPVVELTTLLTRPGAVLLAAGGAPVPWLSQSPESAARAMLRGIERDRETIYTSWLLRPMLLFNHLLPFARRWYQALDGRLQQRHWADQAKSESNHER